MAGVCSAESDVTHATNIKPQNGNGECIGKILMVDCSNSAVRKRTAEGALLSPLGSLPNMRLGESAVWTRISYA